MHMEAVALQGETTEEATELTAGTRAVELVGSTVMVAEAMVAAVAAVADFEWSSLRLYIHRARPE